MNEKMLRGFRKIDPMFLLCDHLFGEDHPRWVRAMVGLVTMTVGVAIAKFSTHFLGEHEVIHFLGDEIGYAIHAMGATPYIEGAIAYGLAARKTLRGDLNELKEIMENEEPGA